MSDHDYGSIDQCAYSPCSERVQWWRESTYNSQRTVWMCQVHRDEEETGDRDMKGESPDYFSVWLVVNDEAVIDYLAEQARRLAHAG